MSSDLHLRFRERSPVNSYSDVSTSTNTSTPSLTSKTGIGSDLAWFLHWIGSRVLNATLQLAIKRRLSCIAKFLSRREKWSLTQKRFNQFQQYCADLLELCRPDHPVKTRQRSLNMVLTLFHPPTDQYSVLLLESDFAEMLTCVTADCAATDERDFHDLDPDLVALGQSVLEIIHITKTFCAFHCICATCLNFDIDTELECRCPSPCACYCQHRGFV